GDIGGDEQRIHSTDTRYDDVTFKHILLPVWISAYRYREKVYRRLVNARTGEVQGERPWSWIKIALLVLFVAALVIVGVVLWRDHQGASGAYSSYSAMVGAVGTARPHPARLGSPPSPNSGGRPSVEEA
ncbi:MAG: hypothetical protein JO040_12240, partial [Gemmatimonadetes bacterium]|nr:hypothetical protein [Gemmatimonadota bacterium]